VHSVTATLGTEKEHCMSNLGDNFKINLNQNLWGLIVGLVPLGCAEYYELNVLLWFSVVVSSIMILSLIATTIAYTIKYCRQKWR
jgi:hypothetical protein